MSNNMLIVLVSGKSQSGKDTFVDHAMKLMETNGFSCSKELISGDMKKWAEIDFEPLVNLLWSKADEIKAMVDSISEIVRSPAYEAYYQQFLDKVNALKIRKHNWYAEKTDLTRLLLQLYGTNIFQKRVDENYWCQLAFTRILESNKHFVFIPDVRFPENIDFFANGCSPSVGIYTTTVRIDRPLIIRKNEHESETALDGYDHWDFQIQNQGTRDEFIQACQVVVPELIDLYTNLTGRVIR